MRRREFTTLLGGAAVGWPLAARAQQAGKLPTIGFLGMNPPAGLGAQSQWTAAFVQRLRELGWIEGRTVVIEYRWGEGRTERAAEFATEFVRLKVDVIVTVGAAVPAAKQVTSVIPIVFAVANDLGRQGLGRESGPTRRQRHRSVDPIDRSCWQETPAPARGSSGFPPIGGPSQCRLPRHNAQEIGEVQARARTLGLEVATFDIQRVEDIAPAFDALNGRADALYIISDPHIISDPLVSSNPIRINTLSLGRDWSSPPSSSCEVVPVV
jgi:putative ABC transport system substrate-binding protein